MNRFPEPTPGPSVGGEPDSGIPLLGEVRGGFRPLRFMGENQGEGKSGCIIPSQRAAAPTGPVRSLTPSRQAAKTGGRGLAAGKEG